MIAEILDSTSFASVIDYHCEKIKKGVAKPVNHQLDRDAALKLLREPTVIRNAYRKPYKKEPLFHVVFSPSKEDSAILTEEQILSLAHDYMEQMGFSNHELLIYKHEDTEHPHFHFVCNRIDLNTMKKTEQSFEKLKSVNIMEQLSRKYGLRTAKEQGNQQANEHKESAGAKKALENDVRTAVEQSASYEEFLLNLLFLNTELKESNQYKRRNNKAYTYHFKYMGQKKNMSSSAIRPSLKSIRSAFDKLPVEEKIRRKVNFVLRNYKGDIENPYMLNALLNRMGVEVEFSKHQDNSIFGCSFIDTATKKKIKASNIKLSWNILKTQINNVSDTKQDDIDPNFQYAAWIQYKADDVRRLCDWSEKEKKAAILANHGRPSPFDYRKASFYKKQEYIYASVMRNKSLYDIPGVSINLVSKNGIAIDVDYDGVKLSDLFGENPMTLFNELFTETAAEEKKTLKKETGVGHSVIQGFSRHSDNETLEEQQRRIRRELGI